MPEGNGRPPLGPTKIIGGLAALFLALWFFAPSTIFGIDLVPLQILRGTTLAGKMRIMCEKDAGVRIYKHVANVEGYAILPEDDAPTIEEISAGNASNATMKGGCFPCFEHLIRDGYEYIETYYIKASERVATRGFGFRRDYDVNRTGLYRYKLIEREKNPDLCIPYDRMVYETRGPAKLNPSLSDSSMGLFARQHLKYEKQMEGKCIYAEPIKQFSAPYLKRLRAEIVGESNRQGQLYKIRSTVAAADGSLVAEGVAYSRVVGTDLMSIPEARCGNSVLPPITELLQPARDRKTD